MPIEVFNQLQVDVINYLLAVHERKIPPETLRDYMRAFDGGFEPGMKFTLHTPVANRLVMYVYEENCDASATPRYEFTRQCKNIAKTLVTIADFLVYLQEQRYVNGEYRGNKMIPVPKNFKKCWRRFEEFYSRESEPILFVKALAITPTEKLYVLRNTFQT
jgi:hypothetical protein